MWAEAAWSVIAGITGDMDIADPKKSVATASRAWRKHARALIKWIAKKPDLTLEELRELCHDKLKVNIGINALWHRLDTLGLRYKKNDTRRRARQARCAGGQKAMAHAPEKTAG